MAVSGLKFNLRARQDRKLKLKNGTSNVNQNELLSVIHSSSGFAGGKNKPQVRLGRHNVMALSDLAHLAEDGREPDVEYAEHRLEDEVGREGPCGGWIL